MVKESLPASLCQVVGEVIVENILDLKQKVKKELAWVRLSLRDDMKAHMDDLTKEINQKVKITAGKIEEVAEHLAGM